VGDETPHLPEFVVHAALDVVDSARGGKECYLKQVYVFNETFVVHAYVMPCGIRLLLVHTNPAPPDSAVKHFFHDVHALLAIAVQNPMASVGDGGLRDPRLPLVQCAGIAEKIKAMGARLRPV